MGSLEYDVFISYARRDDAEGWVSGLRDAIYDDFKNFSSEPFRIFLDQSEIHSRQDWEQRLREGLRSARVLLVCLSPNYLRSAYCRWEWEEFARIQARRIGGGDAVTGVYFVELGGDEDYGDQISVWRHQIERVQLEQLQPWFPSGVQALREAEVRRRVNALGQGVHEQLSQARLAKRAPGNLRRHNPGFVGRVGELASLRKQLSGGAVGVVSAVHGIGGMGKTELAVTYAHSFAHGYQGGTWQVDADGQTDMLEAVSTLALSPELGLDVRQEHLKDRQWLGRHVLARLGELTEAARQRDPDTAACLLLLDNVSESELLSLTQLAVLPNEPWLHVAVTTRLGLSDIGVAGSRGSVAMIEVDRLNPDDALALMREHQPARDVALLHTDFSSPHEEDAAQEIVKLLDGYTLAIEQAAVYLGTGGSEPSELLVILQEQGSGVLDEVARSAGTAGAILHKEKIAGAIVDQTLQRLPQRAREALGFASLLPPDTIPWDWLRRLTGHAENRSPTTLPGLIGGDDWSSTRRILEGRRLLTLADDIRFARLHRVLQTHFRARLTNPLLETRLDAHLQDAAQNLREASAPDTALLALTTSTLTARLVAGRDELADAALGLSDEIRYRLDLTRANGLARATLSSYKRLTKADPHNDGYQRRMSVSLNKVGDLLADRGDVPAALKHYNRSLAIAERLAAGDPDNMQYQRDVSYCLNRVGDRLVARGDMQGALKLHTRSLAIQEQLVSIDPDNTKFQRDLLVSLNSLGDLLVDRGEVEGALEHYLRSLAIAQRMVAPDPDNTRYQREVSVGLNKMGDLLADRGEVQAALEHYSRSLVIHERLAAADPDNTVYQRDLSACLNKVGVLLAARGDVERALKLHTRSLAIDERLAAADPNQTRYQRDVSFSLNKIADLLADRGDVQAALQHYSRSLAIDERLAAADPEIMGFQRDVSVSLNKIGDLLADGGDVQAALERYNRSLRVRERLAAAEPDNTEFQRDVSVSLNRVGDLLADGGDVQAALEHYRRSLAVAQRLAAADPDNTVYQRDVSASLNNLGDLLADCGQAQAALDHYRHSLAIAKRLAAIDPDNFTYQRDMAVSLNNVAVLLADGGQVQAALDHYRRSLHVRERLAAADPDNTGFQRDVALAASRLASLLESDGDLSARDHWLRAHRIFAALDAASKLRDADKPLLKYLRQKLGLQA